MWGGVLRRGCLVTPFWVSRMDIITFQCTNCQKVMRIGADKAGKRAKCSKCGTSLVIPAQSQPLNTATQQARKDIFGEDDEALYTFQQDAAPVDDATKKKEKISIKDLYDIDDDDEEKDD